MEWIADRMKMNAMKEYGQELELCSVNEKYNVLAKTVMEEIIPQWIDSKNKFRDKKQACYLSAEYLIGRALKNNLINLKAKDQVHDILSDLGIDFNDLEEAEEDAGLGNGGLGRLAACFLDSAATKSLPMDGYGIRYKYGIFKQYFEEGFQIEQGDDWTTYGDPWSIRRDSQAVKVSFAEQEVLAVPYDIPVVGYDQKTINTLRLWQSEAIEEFDFREFDKQNYDLAVKERNRAEAISKVLYPNDSTDEGRKLRLKQQYLFVSATLQDLLRKHKARGHPPQQFHDFHSVQLNDTHPAVAIPELMRLLTSQEQLSWDRAWEIVVESFAYTNHTLMAEALEVWPIHLFKEILPEIYQVIVKIDKQLRQELQDKGVPNTEQKNYRIISGDLIKMAWLSIYGSKSTNGVAQLHTSILADQQLNHWYQLYPERFNNKTNGITQRRWLLQSNPELSELVSELLNSREWITDLTQLKQLERYAQDKQVLDRFLQIKQTKKNQLADYIERMEGEALDRNSIFDIHIKRIHEYKRQLLKAFYILDLYYQLKQDRELDIYPRTFIFGGKAAPGYFRAKAVIKYINEIKKLVNNDSDVNDKIKVVFVQNYRVSYAEKLFPAADISEQISTAGYEASGTGNMKFMLNGAPTVGTYDGANVEIVEKAGAENNFIFGLTVEDIQNIKANYDPVMECRQTPGLEKVINTLIDGTFDDGGTGMFRELYDSIFTGASWHPPDQFFVVKDFASYREIQKQVDLAYRDRMDWAEKSWLNISNAGDFSSDRTIEQYGEEIWDVDKA